MRIAVNTRLLLKGKLEGIGWFTYHTLSRIVRSHPEHEFIFLFDRPFDPSFVFAPNVTPVVVPPPARHPFLFIAWFEAAVPLALKKYKADLFLSPDGHSSLSTKVPTCLVIHDLAFEHYPDHVSPLIRRYWKFFSPRFARHARQIATVSEFSRQDIAKRYRIPTDRITVCCNGAAEVFVPFDEIQKQSVRDQYTSGCQYFLFAGALHPRKNVVRLLEAFVAFKKHHRSNMKLVIVGRDAWLFEELATMRKEMPYRDDVVWTGYQELSELARLTAAAYAMVYASLFEGFGIPILEALQCGVPVIASNTSSMPEVAGEAGLLVDPTDASDIAAKMGLLYRDEALRRRLIERAPEQTRKFTWDIAAERLWGSMMKALGEG